MTGPGRLRVLCVDDEPNVLEGLSAHLRRRYEVATATSGAAGLASLSHAAGTAVVLSDMRMPGMDGAAFLAKAREAAPDAVRILLTGQADLVAAAAAINQGRIFRFLTKPCLPGDLLDAVNAAVEQHRLLTSERVLLEETLRGSIKALTDVLALTSPAAFGRATRIRQGVSALAARVGLRECWPVEVAAMVSQLGFIALPAEVVDKVYFGLPLTEEEQTMLARVPSVTEQLLGNIPRLEVVREILAASARSFRAPSSDGREDESARRSAIYAGLLRVAIDFDALESRGASRSLALDTLRGRSHQYAPDALAALAAIHGGAPEREVRELPLVGLRAGMVLAADLKLTTGVLLAARGSEITTSFLERARNFRARTVREPVRVIVGGGAEHA